LIESVPGRWWPSLRPAPVRTGAGSLHSGLALALVAVLATVTRAGAGGEPAGAYPDAPPAGFSGGFGESTCHACHFTAEPNSGPGSVELIGLPEAYEPDQRYAITVQLVRPGLVLGGFQLTARYAETGAQAGTLEAAPEDAERVGVTVNRDVAYAHHRLPGTIPVSTDTARWTILWTAPGEGAGSVLFHVAANAADGDESTYGDVIFTAESAIAAGE